MRVLIVLSVVLVAGCPNRRNVPCNDNSNCDLAVGGACLAGPGSDSWCAYPDPNCPGGYRYSDFEIGDGVSGECVGDSTDAGMDAPSACSPLIAFTRPDGLYVINPDGTGIASRATGNYEENPVWSPDGKRLLFERGRGIDQAKDIWSVNVDGTGLANLTQGAAGNDQQPAWSPDGTKIAFIAKRDGMTDDLWIMDSDGRNQRKLDEKSNNPSWSPDGTKIAYASYKNVRFQIYTINPDGTGSTNLSMSSFADGNPQYAPNGSKIVFMGNRGSFGSTIYIMNPDGTNQQALVPSLQINYDPVWSRNSLRLAFVGDTTPDQVDVYRVDVNGMNLTNLTSGVMTDDQEPTWSPDSKQLAIISQRDGNYEVYRLNDDATGPVRMTMTSLVTESAPAWSPCP